MKKGISIILIGGSLLSFTGCESSTKEIVIETVKEENTKLDLKEINNKENGEYYLNSYLNWEYYLAKKVSEKESEEAYKLINGFEENLYKLNENNEFEKSDKKLSYRKKKEDLTFVENDSDEVRYFNNETGEEKIFNINMEDTSSGSVELVEGIKKVCFLMKRKIEDKNFLEIIDIEKNTGKKVNKVFEEPIRAVIYSDNYYALDDKFKLYKLKENNKDFEVEKTIDLMKEFNIKLHDKGFFVGRIFLKESGEVYLEGIDNESGKEHTDSCGQAFFRYNLKTKEKGRLDYKLEKDMFISDYSIKNDYIVLKSFDNIEKEISNERVYIGKVSNDKIEIIEEIDVKRDGDMIMNVEAMFNDKGDEVLIHYTKTKNKKGLEEYLKVTIK
ncbi:MAG: hypothetical protein ACRDAU_09285 [Clostridium sp.]